MAERGALSSDEVNLLIYRYLLEAGFTHSAFVFGCESTVSKADVKAKEVPFGALVSFIQKGFMYMEVEANLTEDGADVYSEFTPLSARDLLTKDVSELREAVREMKLPNGTDNSGPAAMEVTPLASVPAFAADAAAVELPASALTSLHGHTGDLHSLSWSTTAGLLASGSSDGSVRAWDLHSGRMAWNVTPPPGGEDDMVIVTEWAPDRELVAAGTSGGALAVWSADGQLWASLQSYKAAVVALKWSRHGDWLASAGADGTVIVWVVDREARGGHVSHSWALHTGGVLDVDWGAGGLLAAASADGSVAMCEVGKPQPRLFKGHATDSTGSPSSGSPGQSAEVNTVRWDPSGRLLASASNDMTVRVWSGSNDDAPALVLRGHKREVVTLDWRPQAAGAGAVVASGSTDGSVRLWSADRGECVGVLDRHQGGISCMAWSPDGRHLVCGDDEGHVDVWAVTEQAGGTLAGRVTCTVRMQGLVADVQWALQGSALAVAATESSAITVAALPLSGPGDAT